MKLLPIISAVIPVIITLSVFDNALLSDTASSSINKSSKIYQGYLSVRSTILPLKKELPKNQIKTIRNVTKNTHTLEIASNWKSSTLIR
jgi:hypothetical protein